MREMVLLTFFLVLFSLLVWSLYYFILFDKRVERRIQFYFGIDKNSKKEAIKKETVKELSGIKRLNERIRRRLSAINQEKIGIMLKSAGVSLSPEEYIMLRWFIAIVTGGIMYLLFSNVLFFIIGSGVGYVSPKLLMKKKVKVRIQRFNESLPDMISTIIGSLRSGYSFSQAFKTVVEECDGPVKDEIMLLLNELNYGITMEEALHHLNSRMPSKDLELMIQAVLIQRQVGGNLAGVLEIIVGTIRERNRIQRQVQTLTAQGRLSGRVIGALPVVLGFMIFMINPEYIQTLFTNTFGIIIISVGAVSGIIGFILINKLTKIEV